MMKLPDSPTAPPWLQKIQYLIDPIGYLESNHQRYGDIFNSPILGNSKQQLLVSHPEGLQQLMSEWLESFASPSIASLFVLPFLRKNLGPWSPWGYFRRLQQQIDQFIYTEISERRLQHDPAATDILSLLLSATDEEGIRYP